MNITNDVLNEKKVKENLKTDVNCKIVVMNSVTSTNALVKEYAAEGEAEGFILIANSQSAGKGRMERSFFSPGGTGLYMSILLRPKLPAEKSLYITTAAAAAAACSVEHISGQSASIKWVNDIFVNNRKVCGILTEASLDPQNGEIKYAVLGIGMNIYPPQNGFPGDLTNVAGFIASSGENLRARIAADFIDRFFVYYANLAEKPFYSEYVSRSFLIGKKVDIISPAESYAALITGIDDEFGLELILKDGSKRTLNSGEVSIGSSEVTEI